MPPRRRRQRVRETPSSSLRLGVLLTLLVGLNVYVFFFRGGTSLRDVLRQQAVQGPPGMADDEASLLHQGAKTLPPEKVPPPVLEDEDARQVEGKMGKSDTLAALLHREGVSPVQVEAVVRALHGLWDPRLVQEGQAYLLGFDAEGQLRTLEYRVSPVLTYRVERDRDGDGKFTAKRLDRQLETRIVEVGSVIQDSLYQAILRSGEATSLVSFFVDVFSWDINFYVDTQAGDRFRMLVEKKYMGGNFYVYGRVLAAEYAGRVGTFRAFWFAPPDGSQGGYYDEKGESIVKSMLKTPIKFVRISSKFDRHRLHPILHTERAHLGIDYAAPQGTPVWASANGRVTFVGPRSGSGNTIIVAHANGMETRYYHLSRYAKGLRAGQTVRQKQVIGYVGMTGLATGPHLHFSVTMHGAFIDPNKLKPTRDAPIPPRFAAAFREQVEGRVAALARVETPSFVRHLERGAVPPP